MSGKPDIVGMIRGNSLRWAGWAYPDETCEEGTQKNFMKAI